MFSVRAVCPSVILSMREGSHVTITHDALDLTILVTPPPPPGSALALLDMGPYCIGPPPDMFKLVNYEARKVGKRAISILLEFFLVLFMLAVVLTIRPGS